jgi:hypothetical protein
MRWCWVTCKLLIQYVIAMFSANHRRTPTAWHVETTSLPQATSALAHSETSLPTDNGSTSDMIATAYCRQHTKGTSEEDLAQFSVEAYTALGETQDAIFARVCQTLENLLVSAEQAVLKPVDVHEEMDEPTSVHDSSWLSRSGMTSELMDDATCISSTTYSRPQSWIQYTSDDEAYHPSLDMHGSSRPCHAEQHIAYTSTPDHIGHALPPSVMYTHRQTGEDMGWDSDDRHTAPLSSPTRQQTLSPEPVLRHRRGRASTLPHYLPILPSSSTVLSASTVPSSPTTAKLFQLRHQQSIGHRPSEKSYSRLEDADYGRASPNIQTSRFVTTSPVHSLTRKRGHSRVGSALQHAHSAPSTPSLASRTLGQQRRRDVKRPEGVASRYRSSTTQYPTPWMVLCEFPGLARRLLRRIWALAGWLLRLVIACWLHRGRLVASILGLPRPHLIRGRTGTLARSVRRARVARRSASTVSTPRTSLEIRCPQPRRVAAMTDAYSSTEDEQEPTDQVIYDEADDAPCQDEEVFLCDEELTQPSLDQSQMTYAADDA